MADNPTTIVETTATLRQQVRAAYRATEAEARTASLFRLRWMARRTLRRTEEGDQRVLAALAAIRAEFRHRNEKMPSP